MYFSTGILWFLSCIISAFACSMVAVAMVRFFLRMLFSYHGKKMLFISKRVS